MDQEEDNGREYVENRGLLTFQIKVQVEPRYKFQDTYIMMKYPIKGNKLKRQQLKRQQLKRKHS